MEPAPQGLTDRMPDRPRQRVWKEREPDEETGHQRGDRTQASARIGAHTGTEASVTRRS